LHSEAEQRRWAALVEAVQCSLPTDPQCPGITALTRPAGSVNSKNGRTVEVLQAGTSVTPNAVEEFAARLAAGRFRVIASALLGADRVSPCPVCAGDGTWLDVLDHVGKCYSSCGKVTIGQLYDCILRTEKPPSKTPDTVAGEKAAGSAGKAEPDAKPRPR